MRASGKGRANGPTHRRPMAGGPAATGWAGVASGAGAGSGGGGSNHGREASSCSARKMTNRIITPLKTIPTRSSTIQPHTSRYRRREGYIQEPRPHCHLYDDVHRRPACDPERNGEEPQPRYSVQSFDRISAARMPGCGAGAGAGCPPSAAITAMAIVAPGMRRLCPLVHNVLLNLWAGATMTRQRRPHSSLHFPWDITNYDAAWGMSVVASCNHWRLQVHDTRVVRTARPGRSGTGRHNRGEAA